MKRFICFFLLFAVLLCPAASAEPLRDGDISISAPSAILMEKYTGEVLYEKNAHERIFPASVTKVMTMLLIVEDIVDSGMSMSYLKDNLRTRGPASLKLLTLLDKPERRRVELQADYIGFTIPDEFVVGYGLDYAEHYRNLPDVCILSPKMYA